MKKRIKIKGGLGNQLFQYAYYKYLISKGEHITIDTSWFLGTKKRRNSLSDFQIKSNLNSGIKQLIYRFQKKNLIEGYFQDKKYPEHSKTEIIKELQLKKKSSLFNQILNEIEKKEESIAIHVRRGDYLNLYDIYETCSIKYFKAGIRKINMTGSNYFLFTDDIKWVTQEFKFLEKKIIVSQYNLKDSEELILMSRCKNIIISNSTFSWWAAFLNSNTQKQIICPKKWLKDPSENNQLTSKILLEDWIKL